MHAGVSARSLVGVSDNSTAVQRSRLAVVGGNVLWQVVGVAVGAISYAAEAGGFELEMLRAALRSQR
jgi:hypothetical protein